MDKNRAEKNAARAYMTANDVKYTVALRAVRAAHQAELAAMAERDDAGPTQPNGDPRAIQFSNPEDGSSRASEARRPPTDH